MTLERQQKAARLKEQSETCEDDCGRYGSLINDDELKVAGLYAHGHEQGWDRARLFDTTTKGL